MMMRISLAGPVKSGDKNGKIRAAAGLLPWIILQLCQVQTYHSLISPRVTMPYISPHKTVSYQDVVKFGRLEKTTNHTPMSAMLAPI